MNSKQYVRQGLVLGLWLGTLFVYPSAFAADAELRAFDLAGHYIGDIVYIGEGKSDGRTFVVHEAEAAADIDLEQLAGAQGLSAGVHFLATAGGQPNEAAGTLQGVNNLEVDQHRLRLYQVWLEQTFAADRASLRVGLTDLNSDFYQNESAGLLLGPAFGLGSELAATGPNGPSTFPSTALTARLSYRVGRTAYGKIAVINAKAGVLGEPNGIDFGMHHSALLIGEVGTVGRGKLALGAWGYTEAQDDIYQVRSDASPAKRTAAGAYLLAEYRLTEKEAPGVHAFLRVGRSDGATTPFRGGFQAGVLMNGAIAARADSKVSFGVHQGQLSKGFRRLLLDEHGRKAESSEWGLELTYSDNLTPYLAIQPDLQFIRRSFAENGERSTVVFTIRTTIDFSELG
ncbi:carbohydrate porin [Novosphingobium sp. M1R2S20]|uniref:Carbohydrate porin n=1 Tax=Novosphingobium rhizovicinum TaxID=3228928 RepID=A0ABV3RE44_9SPHN